MEFNEKIVVHLVSVWREEKKFLSVGGKECMLFLTNRHLTLIQKTEKQKKWWGAVTQRQVLTLTRSNNTMIRQDGYDEEDLKIDLENKKNLEIPFSSVLKVSSEEKAWGSVLNLEFLDGYSKKKSFQFSIVQDWVKYPAKDPIKYMKVDWQPVEQFIKDRMTNK